MILFCVSALSEIWQVGSFTATRVEFDKAQPKKEKRSKVHMSKLGMREEELVIQKSSDAQFVVVMNFEKGKTWFLVPHRKVYMEPPAANTAGVTVKDEPGTVLAPAPCDSYTLIEKRKATQHDERNVEEWYCHSDATGDVIQLFDPALRVVVRNEDAKGRVIELRNIQEGKQPDSLFTIPEGYRKANMREILTGTTELPVYPEQPEKTK